MKSFFYHENRMGDRKWALPRSSSGGFTVNIEGPFDDSATGDQYVNVRATFMNPSDKCFNKKIARQAALNKDPLKVRVRDLPLHLAYVKERARVGANPGDDYQGPDEKWMRQDSHLYNFILKNFV